ncbi:MAG: DNA methyltransferase [Chthoniobacterales bacterium]
MPNELKQSLPDFARFARSLHGDEKSEAQAFLERFFRALGHDGVLEAGATFEFRVQKKPGTAQLEVVKGEEARKSYGKKFADLLWPGRVLIEMKSRGAKLERHYDQAFEYWQLIVPDRPRYVILCNFDEFWIYDFNQQLYEPVERVNLRLLPESISAFNFMLPAERKPIFGNNRVEVTRRAADLMARVFREILARGEDRARAQRFILQLLISMVAEDIDLLPRDIVTELLYESSQGGSSYDLFGGLFRQMATKEPARAGRFQAVQYFNGGLFEVVDPIELKLAEVYALHEAALHNDWSKVKPEIFGTLFQQSMDAGEKPGTRDERHAFGAHFTSEFDIQKVVGPTIVRPWKERIEGCGKDKAKLRAALDDLRRFRVLDPACGSGNFLFVAYRECKRLERDLLARLHRAGAGGTFTSEVPLSNFFGIDVLPFAAELAKVTLMLAKELEIREARAFGQTEDLFIEEKALPLENLDANILCADALFTEWPAADAIIGNPPYLGSRFIAKEHGRDYTKRLYARFPTVPKMADFCTHWFRLAHDSLPLGGRAGLVGTNTIRQNEAREASLDYIVANGGVITEAVATEKWSGEAQVSVSIVNWLKGEAVGPKRLLTQRGDSVGSPWQIEDLAVILPTLRSGADVTGAVKLAVNKTPKGVFQGQKPNHEGFFLEAAEAAEILQKSPQHRDVLFPYLIGLDLVEGSGPTRWVIDFAERDAFAARSYEAAFERIRERVRPAIVEKADREKAQVGNASGPWARMANRWWIYERHRADCIAAINAIPRYIALSRVTKRPIFDFVASSIHPDTALIVFAFADDYSFGILQSGMHWEWFKARCSTLESRLRYTSDTVFDTFPWPQSPTRGQIAEVAAAAVALRALRREVMAEHGWSLRELYRTLDEPGDNPLRTAQACLDTAVRAAYGMPPDADPLAFLLQLNLACAAKEKAGDKITPPGLPLPEAERAPFITRDCIHIGAVGSWDET